MKKLTSILLVITLVITLTVPALATNGQTQSSFSDVSTDHWAYQYISSLTDKGIINGMGDGTYAPNGTVTRGQFLKLITCVIGTHDKTTSDMAFTDVAVTDWVYKYVCTGIDKGILGTTELNTKQFRPNDTIDRQTATLWLIRALGISDEGKQVGYSDITTTDNETLQAIATAENEGLMTGYPDGTFGPSKTLTRAESAAIVYRMYNKYTNINTPRVATNTVELNDNTKSIDCDSSNELTETNTTENYFVLSNIDDSIRNLKAGDVAVLKPCAKLPDGLAFKVKNISIENNTAKVWKDDPTLKETYKTIDINKSIPVDATGFKLADGVTVKEAGTANSESKGTASLQEYTGGSSSLPDIVFTLSNKFKDSNGDYVEVSGNITAKLSVNADIYYHNFTIDEASASVTSDVKTDVTYSLGHENSKDSATLTFADKTIPIRDIPGLGVELKLYLKVDVDGKISIGITTDTVSTAGVTYDGNSVKAVKNPDTSDSHMDNLSESIDLDVDIGMSVGLEFLEHEFMSVNLEFGPHIEAKNKSIDLNVSDDITYDDAVKLQQSDPDDVKVDNTSISYHACNNCIDGLLSLKLDLSANYDFENPFGDDLEGSLDIYSHSWDISKFYINSDGTFGLGECPNWKTVIFKIPALQNGEYKFCIISNNIRRTQDGWYVKAGNITFNEYADDDVQTWHVGSVIDYQGNKVTIKSMSHIADDGSYVKDDSMQSNFENINISNNRYTEYDFILSHEYNSTTWYAGDDDGGSMWYYTDYTSFFVPNSAVLQIEIPYIVKVNSLEDMVSKWSSKANVIVEVYDNKVQDVERMYHP